MTRRILKNKPHFHYKLSVGRVYDRIKHEYPFREQLPTATMPDEIAEDDVIG